MSQSMVTGHAPRRLWIVIEETYFAIESVLLFSMTVASWLLLRRDHVVKFASSEGRGADFSKLRGIRSATTVARLSARCSAALGLQDKQE